MDYAIQLLIPLFAGLFLGLWLTKNYGLSPLWTVLLAIIGFFLGVGVMMKRLIFTAPPLKKHVYRNSQLQTPPPESPPKPAGLKQENPSEGNSESEEGFTK